MNKLLLSLVLLFSTSVYAKDNAFIVQEGLEHTSNSNYGDSWTYSARYEKRVWGNLWLGPEYTYHSPMLHHNGNDDTQFDYGDLSGHSLLADLIWHSDIVLVGFSPYLIGGAGWSWWGFEESEKVETLGISVNMGDAFAYKVGTGATYPINNHWSFIIEWSFFKSKIPYIATHLDGTPSTILGNDDSSGEVKLGEEETRLVGGMRYKF